jgi:dUTP pyrophosphatase
LLTTPASVRHLARCAASSQDGVMPEDALKVKLLRPDAKAPFRATPGSTGLDLYACIDAEGYVDLGPDVKLVPTGIALEAPVGWDVQVRPRSGLGRQGVTIVYGTIDPDYRGEIFVSMHTFGSKQSYRVQDGDRIAQIVITRALMSDVTVVEDLSDSSRGAGGHGSTGR